MIDERRDIDEIIVRVKQEIPEVRVDQLKVTHPGADDDGLWYFSLPNVDDDIQIESSYGMGPFIVETNEQSSYDARTANTIDETVSMIVDYLNSKTTIDRWPLIYYCLFPRSDLLFSRLEPITPEKRSGRLAYEAIHSRSLSTL
ncbi:MAG: hypothetical protein ABI878_11490 [Acidobacteriota bacterium]